MPKVAAKDRDAFYEGRRREIMEAALKLWSDRGFDATSMEAIAVEVGVSKGTLYLYFASKDALLESIVRRYSLLPDVAQLADGLREVPLETVVHLLVTAVWERMTQHRDLVLMLMREMPGHLEKAQLLLEQVVLPINRLIAELITERLPAERAREIDVFVASRALVGMVLVWFTSQHVLGAHRIEPVPDERAIDTIVELFLNGVGGRGGRDPRDPSVRPEGTPDPARASAETPEPEPGS